MLMLLNLDLDFDKSGIMVTLHLAKRPKTSSPPLRCRIVEHFGADGSVYQYVLHIPTDDEIGLRSNGEEVM
ncbi:hypothetical protein QYF36_000909 [Acer negundo]|nr:hypothetical protein QYF36_000909 [Acer negundo]